jgi:peptidoglycan/LPS O-acetylase OafA/YrhL
VRIYQLDGLRALAVFLVLLFHHGIVRSGWVGVDIFFVLSGFLITGILRREVNRPGYWKSFYVKRATRILPPLAALVIPVFLVAGHFKLIYLGYLFFASNLVQLSPAALAPLGALWSLAIEEHFYFLWPLAVKRLDRERLLRVSLGIVLVSPLVRILGTALFHHYWGVDHHWDNPIFLLTPFRIDGLAAGAALALLLEDGRRPAVLLRWSGSASLAIAALFLGLEFFVKSFRRTADTELFNGFGYSLVVSAAFFLVSYLVLVPSSMVAKLLSSRILVFVGTISYGFYLFQELAKEVLRSFLGASASHVFLFLPDLAITAALATFSFYFFEKPIMGLGKAWLTGSHASVSRCEHQKVVQVGFNQRKAPSSS